MKKLEIISNFMNRLDCLEIDEIVKNIVELCDLDAEDEEILKEALANTDFDVENAVGIVNDEYYIEKLQFFSDFMDNVKCGEYWHKTYYIAENIVKLCDFDFYDEQTKMLAAALEAKLNVEDAVNIIVNNECSLYDAFDYEELGEEILYDELHRNVDCFSSKRDPFLEHIEPFIDYERYGRAYCTNNTCYFTEYGVLETFAF